MQNWRLYEDHMNRLRTIRFAFEFINNFAATFFLAFIVPTASIREQFEDSNAIPTSDLNCTSSGCLSDLGEQVLGLLCSKFIIGNSIELVRPRLDMVRKYLRFDLFFTGNIMPEDAFLCSKSDEGMLVFCLELSG